MAPLLVRHAEQRITYLLRKLAWLSFFMVAKKSLIYWTEAVK